ncbi:serine hydrolase, partial [Mangrovactinospora gilvigrisea]|uniref:serine hydrolase n=1 Tax=Mangrovactinospora gilvigrisea TaxID=1428644 RepID=UPI001114E66E
KVDILSAVLLKAEDEKRPLTAAERGHAELMIRRSDNDATDALYTDIGYDRGLDAANRRLGLSATTAGRDKHWGLTETTAADQLRLLRLVLTDEESDDNPLSPSSRSYIRSLMSTVEPDQTWGVSAADSDDSGFELKNGWLSLDPDGTWIINSIGIVDHDGDDVLIAVLGNKQPSEAAGIQRAEAAASAAADAVTG